MQEKNLQKNALLENGSEDPLAKELKDKLDWYIDKATEEEYDEKAVDYILYLLDSVEPFAEDGIPRTDEALQRFRMLVKQRQHQALREQAVQEVVQGRKERGGKIAGFMQRHKIAAAVLLVLLALAVGSTAQTVARKDTGFFLWLKQDNTGKQMITSPESLDDETEVRKIAYFDKDDLPEWTREWLVIEENLEISENYAWQRFETSVSGSVQTIASYYVNKDTENELVFGMKLFFDSISYNSGKYDDYVYLESYEEDDKFMEIYFRTEESGKMSYVVYFIEKNRGYFILGQEDLDELLFFSKLYWDCVENNL